MEISTTFRRKIEDIDEDAEFLTQPVSDDRTHELMRVAKRNGWANGGLMVFNGV